MLRHLVALSVEYQSGRDDVLEGHAVENHRSDGMQGKEPATGLVNALIDEIAGESNMLVDEIGIFERIVYLSVWHRAGVEPHVDEVALALHLLARGRNEEDVIDIRTVQVDLVVVLLRHVARNEALVFQQIALHDTSLDGFLYLVVQLFYTADADFLAIL